MFSRAFLPAAGEAGLPVALVTRHLPVLRECVMPEETPLLVAACQRPGQPAAGVFLFLVTSRRLVITREFLPAGWVRPHLTAGLRELSEVSWVPDGRSQAIEIAFTAPDRVRERFWIPVRGPHRAAHLDALFRHAFVGSAAAAATGPVRAA